MRLGELREGLGRLQFAAGPLEHLRPFLGPLYRWACVGHKYARPKLPLMIVLIMKYISGEMKRSCMSKCATKTRDLGEVFRLDAKAEGNVVAIGGWATEKGRATKESKWFACSLDRNNAPWAFHRGEAFRTIASLELLGALVGVMVLLPENELNLNAVGMVTLTCGTDNQGNGYLLDKLLTTKYPLAILLMELSCQLGMRGASMRARWILRLQNEEADALTNGDYRHSDAKLRIPVDLGALPFKVLNDMFAVGEDYVKELEAMKEKGTINAGTSSGLGSGKTKKGQALRDRDPW